MREESEFMVSPKNIDASSAYRDVVFPLFPPEPEVDSDCQIAAASGLIANANEGNGGHPCRALYEEEMKQRGIY